MKIETVVADLAVADATQAVPRAVRTGGIEVGKFLV
jgi:hypothetical protein